VLGVIREAEEITRALTGRLRGGGAHGR
jgi:hypothetical protein